MAAMRYSQLLQLEFCYYLCRSSLQRGDGTCERPESYVIAVKYRGGPILPRLIVQSASRRSTCCNLSYSGCLFSIAQNYTLDRAGPQALVFEVGLEQWGPALAIRKLGKNFPALSEWFPRN